MFSSLLIAWTPYFHVEAAAVGALNERVERFRALYQLASAQGTVRCVFGSQR